MHSEGEEPIPRIKRKQGTCSRTTYEFEAGNFEERRGSPVCNVPNQQDLISDFLYSALSAGTGFERSMVRSLFPTGELRAMNLMHSQNPLRSPGAWHAYR